VTSGEEEFRQEAIQHLDALHNLGPEVESARYEGRHMNPRDALARLARDV